MAVRPFFDSEEKHPHCPYCNAAKRWHSRLDTVRIEGVRSTDVARRALTKSLPTKDNQFQFIETKSDRRSLFFDWLDTQRSNLDLDNDSWLIEATRAFLERVEPKHDWSEVFADLKAVRRSQHSGETGGEVIGRFSPGQALLCSGSPRVSGQGKIRLLPIRYLV